MNLCLGQLILTFLSLLCIPFREQIEVESVRVVTNSLRRLSLLYVWLWSKCPVPKHQHHLIRKNSLSRNKYKVFLLAPSEYKLLQRLELK